jgi:hypothetical protein
MISLQPYLLYHCAQLKKRPAPGDGHSRVPPLLLVLLGPGHDAAAGSAQSI